MHLVTDDREKFVYPELEKVFADNKNVLNRKRLSVGDFAIYNGEKILAIIERKTLIDYAAGIKDGRYENVSELINLRKETGCKIIFIIENKTPFPSLTRKFNGIPFKSLLASIDMLIFRSDIHIIYTKDPEHTAERLHNIHSRYMKIEDDQSKGRVSVSLKHVDQNIVEIKLEKSGGEEFAKQIKFSSDKKKELSSALSNVPARLTDKIEKDDDRLIKEMWKSVGDGISYNIAGIISNLFSVNDLVNKINVKEIKSITNESGRKISTKAIKTLIAIKNKDKDCFTKLLVGVPSIGKTSAQKIIENISVTDLLNLTPDKMDEIKIEGKRVRAKLENVKKFFDYKIQKSENLDEKTNNSDSKFTNTITLEKSQTNQNG